LEEESFALLDIFSSSSSSSSSLSLQLEKMK